MPANNPGAPRSRTADDSRTAVLADGVRRLTGPRNETTLDALHTGTAACTSACGDIEPRGVDLPEACA